jgi:3-deoxy-D-manno-octulosonic-acid transferase
VAHGIRLRLAQQPIAAKMYFLYSFALTLLFLALLPYFIYQAIRHGKYLGSLKERMGRLPESLARDKGETIWVHAVSVGEFLAAKPLLERLRREMADWRIVVSTTTMTGQRLARAGLGRDEAAADYDAVFYFPFDWRFAARRALNRINPSMVIILETEVWPNFLRECRSLGVSAILANGRISPRSFARYRRAGRLIARALCDFDLMIMQSEEYAARARALGARAEKVLVCGNLKYDVKSPRPEAQNSETAAQGLARSTPSLDEEIDFQFALSSSPHLIIAGSTAPGEEEMLLDALRAARTRSELEDARLILAPRHPERFNEVASLISKSEFNLARRSDAKALARALNVEGNDAEPRRVEADINQDLMARMRAADIILLDTIGELASLYRFAAVVFVGGSLVPRGGHNIIEPAVHSKPIIVGPYTENFRQIISDFARAGALVQVGAAGDGARDSFTGELIRLLSDRELASAMGARAHDILLNSRGATGCTMEAIKRVTVNTRLRSSG